MNDLHQDILEFEDGNLRSERARYEKSPPIYSPARISMDDKYAKTTK